MAIKPCIPSIQVAKAELVSKTHSGNVEYYLLGAYELNDKVDLVISLTGDRCREVFYNPMGDVPLLVQLGWGSAPANIRTLSTGNQKIGRENSATTQWSASSKKQVVWWDEEV